MKNGGQRKAQRVANLSFGGAKITGSSVCQRVFTLRIKRPASRSFFSGAAQHSSQIRRGSRRTDATSVPYIYQSERQKIVPTPAANLCSGRGGKRESGGASAVCQITDIYKIVRTPGNQYGSNASVRRIC